MNLMSYTTGQIAGWSMKLTMEADFTGYRLVPFQLRIVLPREVIVTTINGVRLLALGAARLLRVFLKI
jgi:hypothetical protein